MTEHGLPPAITGLEMRVDAVIGELRALRDLLTPAASPEPEPAPEPEIIELREPATPPATHPGAPLAGPTGRAEKPRRPR